MDVGAPVVAARSLSEAVPVLLGQAWLPSPENGFLPGSVRVAATAAEISVDARLDDRDVFTEVREGCCRLWELGDVFEMFFLRPGDGFYSELHVAPDGRLAHLRIPLDRAPELRAGEVKPEEFFVSPPGFSAVVDVATTGWSVRSSIPVAAISAAGPIRAGERWKVSFSRYDAAPGRHRAILSSTSRLVRPDFHAIDCWNELCF